MCNVWNSSLMFYVTIFFHRLTICLASQDGNIERERKCTKHCLSMVLFVKTGSDAIESNESPRTVLETD